MTTRRDEEFMRAALNEAKKALGQTSPNPAVGAVVVIDNRMVAKGHHRKVGRDHAEIECLRDFGARVPARATLYVTLEPCSTAGRTAPCTDAIIKAGIKNVVVGAFDVNPRHSGKGIVQLRNAGVKVREGILADECSRINEAFNKWIVCGRPFVIAKCGMSLDGRLTRPDGEPRWITDPSARRHARRLRAGVDAILVGAETVRADNPRLTVRGVRWVRQPWRVVLTRSGKLPRRARLFSDRFASRTLIYRDKSLATVLKNLGKRGIISVLIEGGGEVLGQALDARLIDKVQLYLGPSLSGGPVIAFPGPGAENTADALRLRCVSYRKIGQSVCITGYPEALPPE
ncbi:MAG: bifunctional diaminohydroxyphosphoribosylaminopyrimidine deaminase/5-amino-6-(5-phosphoribosylamino)uracil reductase RibD [Verrucomicrobia bacterium]|nr:MAG: bifunctional diaminohydroxyphosphoribosylaminopyrimidine deaminase/5-amino-6-(5-phosphoribosylamino)uracil reductase RibD [Verrucomicrobiota bacterium]PYK52329.1 MAG: bifunctional diaminohydroxyphosphoribosylaminopyrimidine deaminase/5-amino-6-(5-phosphoribosylamino)uracil reductase RibD [Verrucomicrobiota bacterium]